jgi:hypothetical protein
MDIQFLDGIFNSIQHPNFFNGRVLTATDLQSERTANLTRSQLLGKGLGEGVVYGLDVSPVQNSLQINISDGSAINRLGEVLHLEKGIPNLALKTPQKPPEDAVFSTCEKPTEPSARPKEFYLLAITASDSQFSEKRIRMGTQSLGGQVGCTHQYEEVGVQFKLISLDEVLKDEIFKPDATELLLFRNRLAMICFGIGEWKNYVTQPALATKGMNLVSILRQWDANKPPLTDRDVPLAVLHIQKGKIAFVDVWAVRRPCMPGLGGDVSINRSEPNQKYFGDAWPNDILATFIAPRRSIESIAFLLQFQKQIEEIFEEDKGKQNNIAASTYFEYLPAAGYLPVQKLQADNLANTSSAIEKFFGVEIQPQKLLETAFIRSLFHESFYVDSIKPGKDLINVYTVKDIPADKHYIIFVRRRRVPVVIEKPPTAATVEETVQTGDLYVAVILADKKTLIPDAAIKSLTAINQKSKERFLEYHKVDPATLSGYTAVNFNAIVGQISASSDTNLKQFIYFFNNLPVGTYTINVAINVETVKPKKYYGLADQVVISANVEKAIAIPVREQSPTKPGRPFIPADKPVVVGGVRVGGGWLDPGWYERIPDWSEHLPGLNPGYVDPAPDDWTEVRDVGITLGVEEILGKSQDLDPWVVAADPKVYVSNTLDPTVPAKSVNAFVQTKDGSRLPFIVQTVDNALNRFASVARTEIRDFDQFTTERLAENSLAQLDAFVSAPVSLLAAVLERSPEYIESLMSESRTVLQEDFRNGFMGYVGICKIESDILKGVYKDVNNNADPVSFANTSEQDTIAKLKEKEITVNESFVERLLSDVRSTVSQKSYTLSGTSMSTDQQKALKDKGVATNKDFRDQAANLDSRNELKRTLKVEEATLNRYLQEAAVDFAVGQFMATPDRSIATLKNVPPDVAVKLADAGYSSVKTLAMSETESSHLANQVGVSIEELIPILTNAANYVGQSYGALVIEGVSGANLTPDDIKQLTNKLKTQYVRPAQVASARLEDIQAISVTVDNQATSLDGNTATTIKNLMTRFQNNVLRGGMR